MQIDIEFISKFLGYIMGIIAFGKIVIAPFKSAMDKNASTMSTLNSSVHDLQRDLQDSKNDRQKIREELKDLDKRVDKNCEDIAKHDERIKTLFSRRGQ